MAEDLKFSISSDKAVKPLSVRIRNVESLKTGQPGLGVYPILSALTIDSQLARLYLESRSSSARKRRREDRKEAMKQRASPTTSSTSRTTQEVIASVVISMPKSHSSADGELGDLFLGTTTMLWSSQTIDKHEEDGDCHTTMMGTGPDP
jgi:hypothetical protein